MADIELVIKIPEELYKNKKGYLTIMDAHMICDAVANGTPLPKGHGQLKDADKIGLTDFECLLCNGDYKEALKMLDDKIKNAPTIIEAESEVQND